MIPVVSYSDNAERITIRPAIKHRIHNKLQLTGDVVNSRQKTSFVAVTVVYRHSYEPKAKFIYMHFSNQSEIVVTFLFIPVKVYLWVIFILKLCCFVQINLYQKNKLLKIGLKLLSKNWPAPW